MDDTASAAEARRWLADFSTALAAGDIAAVLDGFAADCYWRDFVSFTWNIKTLEGKAAIGDMLEAQAFAYLAVRRLRGLPASGPTTTGAAHAVVGGVICDAA